MPIRAGVRDALLDAAALLLPVWCAGCDEPGRSLCPRCRDALRPRPVVRSVGTGVDVVAALEFDGVAARVIRALKEDGRTGLARALGETVAPLLPADAIVVPVPSSRSALRRRGYAPVEVILRAAGRRPARLLVPARRAVDQRGLGRGERSANVTGSLRAQAAPGASVIVVDDVVTTGATLLEAVRALRAAGADVRGAVAVASTPRRR